MPPHHGAGQAPQVRHDNFETFYELIKIDKGLNTNMDNQREYKETLEITKDERKRLKTLYWICLFSGLASLLLVVVAITVIWTFKTDQPLVKIGDIHKAYTERQQQERDTSSNKNLDGKGPQPALPEKPSNQKLPASLEINNILISRLSKEIKDAVNDVWKVREEALLKRADGPDTDRSDKEAGRLAFSKAKELWEKGDIAGAELYFSNAMAKVPDNWGYLDTYTRAVLTWCDRRKTTEEREPAIRVLTDLESFLRSQVQHLKVNDLEKLGKSLTDVLVKKQKLLNRMAFENSKNEELKISEAISKSKDLLSRPVPREPIKLNTYLSNLRDSLRTLRLQGTQTKVEVSQLIRSIEKRITNTEITQQSIVMMQQAKDLLKNAKDKQNQSLSQIYALSSAETIIKQLVILKYRLEPPFAANVDALVVQLDQVARAVSQQQRQRVWKELMEAKGKINDLYSINPDINCAKAIKSLTDFIRLCSRKMADMSDSEAAGKVDEIVVETNHVITQWKTEQLRRYEEWAVTTVKKFYESYKGELGPGTDEDKVYNQLILALGDVDTRYLSIAGARCYIEVFDLFYKELNDKHKIELTARMAIKNKKPLEDF